MISNYDPTVETKWAPVLEGIDDDYKRKVCATLLENQAKSIVSEKADSLTEADTPTTVGKLGTFQKFAFPLVRRVYPQLLANNLVGVQPMQGPVSQIFYLGHDRTNADFANTDTVYSRFNLTYGDLLNSPIGTGKSGSGMGMTGAVDRQGYADFSAANIGLDDLGMADGFATCAHASDAGTIGPAQPSATVGGQIASFPLSTTIVGYAVSAGEALTGDEISEINMHIDQQPVVARTRKMRALWTLEAAQDMRAYHNLDLEGELTSLLSKEIALEIDREIIEDLRMIAYDPNNISGWDVGTLTGGGNSNAFGGQGTTNTPQNLADFNQGNMQTFSPSAFLYDFANADAGSLGQGSVGTNSNVWLVDLADTRTQFGAAPQHVGQVYANLLAIINFASQDIYRTTWRGPGNWLITSPLIASMLESSAKLEGGVSPKDGPTNFGANQISYKGKFMGRYDLWVDPMYPEDEIMIGYKGDNAMDAGYVYAPYIPLQSLPTITDPQTFQPRKGILTRYGKTAVGPFYRFYRIIRIVGAGANYLFNPFGKAGGSAALNSAE